MRHLICVLVLLCSSQIRSFDILVEETPDSGDLGDLLNDFVPEFGERQKRSADSDEDGSEVLSQDSVTLYSYKVESTITSHFANTMIRSKVVNNARTSQNLVFDIQIPKGAFINNFTMNVNGITFSGSIKEKSEAKSLYSKARARGKAAGLMRTKALDMENFKAELNVPAGTKVQFEIHYQEVLHRKLGVYEHVLYLQPGRLAKHFEVDVYISEPQGVSFVTTPRTVKDTFAELININKGDKKAHVSFKPTVDQQRECENCSSSAVDGSLSVRYDVQREKSSEVQIFNGYFLHFFAPENLSPLPKNILFVIDVSGSMWGLKMKQTVEAMKTILEDLRPDDQFGLIDFNHNIRCWKDELVYASSLEVNDAKNYVQAIQPNGGTNINDALLRAIFILTEASNNGLLDSNSVSLIVLVSDGDPTVGELKLSKIQKNVQANIRDDFSLHSLGIGFDVDYDFLERLALENHGMAQRIYGNKDTAAQMKEFYKKVSTPLLKNIILNYPVDGISDITQNSFHNYFKGDEIVVAGKLDAESVPALQTIVSATSANADLLFDTVTEAEALKEFFEENKHAFPDFAKQYWAQLTINQLLAERSLATSAAQKRNITKSILQLSLNHHFVTPFTSLLIESENGQERMLADSPRDPKGGCCYPSLVVGTKVAPQILTQKCPLAAATPSSKIQIALAPEEAKSPPVVELKCPLSSPTPEVEISPPLQYTQTVTTVDGDPHFIISLPKSQTDVCFNVDGQPGSIMSLLSDPELGISINGQIVTAKQAKGGKLNTYFGTMGLHFKELNVKIEITTEKITVKDASYSNVMSWAESTSMTRDRLDISVMQNGNITITLDGDLTFTVLLHRVWKNHPINVDFLGLYISPTNKFSSSVHGLIGQFMNQPEVNIYNMRPGSDPEKPVATMDVKGHKLTVTRGVQQEYQSHPGLATNVRCWFVHNSGKGFIDGHYKDYIVPQLFSFFKRP
ncbi:inter-alpha-trypsin inhibitor heavy chain H2 [Discoglossus pictus]